MTVTDKRCYLLLVAALAVAACGGSEPPPASQAPAQPIETTRVATERPAPVPAVEPIDTDADGVVDAKDICPGTPRGRSVGADGCEPDADADGIADAQDACPDSQRNERVDETGCRPTLSAPREFALGISFPSGSVVLDREAVLRQLKDVIALAKAYPDTRVVIHGYTDSSGSEASNLRLSQQRAEAVASILDGAGLKGRATAEGHGEANPIASNDTSEGRAKNRRLVAVVKQAG